MAEINFQCKRTVVSTKAVKPGTFYSLSVLDRSMEKNVIRIIYYYHFPSKWDAGGPTKKLRESFSELLSSYPIVTGRLQKNPDGHWMIKCNDAGVRWIEARAKGSVDEWLQMADRVQELKLTYREDMFHKPYFWSTFYVQVTEFEGGGLAIGLSCSHLLADAACATMLVKAWADTTLLQKILTPPLFQPLPSSKLSNETTTHNPFNSLIDHYQSAMSMNQTPPISDPENVKYTSVTFAFSSENMKRCMADARTNGSTTPTPFEALGALLWVCVSNVKGKINELLNMSICLDMRNVLGLDKGFFGNVMVFNKVCGEGLNEVGLVRAARAIADVVGQMGNKEVMDLIEWLGSGSGGEKLTHQLPILNGPDLVCVNWDSLAVYAAMFEVRVPPIRVSYYFERVIGEGQILILSSPEGEGTLSRWAMVTLPEDQAVRLCGENLILRYSPTIMMGAPEKNNHTLG
ncbi:protein ECERIFERUM 26-like [Magnolia sinica]|uniref:protein ECERIFERUM 26-like n=1 Tax=Magnolia sinica TaxID=86752 RepID=UPI002659999C|nr:protein ECERIFERUM 26-like [Magnolia sinica]